MYSVKIKDKEDFSTINLSSDLIKAIPPMLRYFPPEYGKDRLETGEGDENLKKINMINNLLDDNKNKRLNSGVAINERKTVEELNNAANYFDMSKKHSFHKNNIDISKIFNNITIIKDNFVLGKKHSRYLLDNIKEENEDDDKENDAYDGLRPKK